MNHLEIEYLNNIVSKWLEKSQWISPWGVPFSPQVRVLREDKLIGYKEHNSDDLMDSWHIHLFKEYDTQKLKWQLTCRNPYISLEDLSQRSKLERGHEDKKYGYLDINDTIDKYIGEFDINLKVCMVSWMNYINDENFEIMKGVNSNRLTRTDTVRKRLKFQPVPVPEPEPEPVPVPEPSNIQLSDFNLITSSFIDPSTGEGYKGGGNGEDVSQLIKQLMGLEDRYLRIEKKEGLTDKPKRVGGWKARISTKYQIPFGSNDYKLASTIIMNIMEEYNLSPREIQHIIQIESPLDYWRINNLLDGFKSLKWKGMETFMRSYVPEIKRTIYRPPDEEDSGDKGGVMYQKMAKLYGSGKKKKSKKKRSKRKKANTVKVSYKGKSRNIPKRYIPDTLKRKERKKQIKSIFERKDRPKTNVKSRKSSWTVLFNQKYGQELNNMKGKKSRKNISKVTGIPLKAINEVYKKGEGAYYSSGSRPNQTSESWARGRLYAYIMGGKEVRRIDNNITKKYKVKFRIKTRRD